MKEELQMLMLIGWQVDMFGFVICRKAYVPLIRINR
jgi:hypothetical protein